MPSNLTVRNWQPTTYNKESRSVQATLATESPVKVFDFRTMDFVDEVLLMSGVVIPNSKQVPLLDSHQRSSTHNVLGSCRNIRKDNNKLLSDIYFSDDNQGQVTEKKVRDGHITDLSVGYQVKSYVDLGVGETKSFNGVKITGPVRVATEWELWEASVTPIGADENSKTRGKKMPEENINNQDQNRGQDHNSNPDPIQAERQRCTEIQEMCKYANLPEFAQRFIQEGTGVEQARNILFKEMYRLNPPIGAGRFSMGETDYMKRTDAMIDGLVLRSGYKPEKVTDGAEQFRNSSIVDIARHCLENNVRMSTQGMSTSQIISRAMQTRMHTSDDFPKILENVGNKMLREAYLEYPSTFETWTVKGEGRDFKEMSRVQLSEAADLKHVPEGAEYMHGSFGESKEVFKIQKYGRIFRISWESLINDDLRAFDRVSKAYIQAAKRGLNAQVYKVLTENNAMADGVALFHADHNNLENETANKGIVSPDRLSAARAKMRLQTGLQTESPLNIEPANLIVPAALESDADIIVNSQIGINGSDVPGAKNPFYQKLNVITEPLLDATSTKAWYLSANPRFFDTIEVAYLDGEEVPYMEEQQDFSVDAWSFKIRFCFGVKALDYRGLFKNPGE